MFSSCYVRHKENELYQLITNATDALLILEAFKIGNRLAIDTETTGLDALGDIFQLSFGKLPDAFKVTERS